MTSFNSGRRRWCWRQRWRFRLRHEQRHGRWHEHRRRLRRRHEHDRRRQRHGHRRRQHESQQQQQLQQQTFLERESFFLLTLLLSSLCSPFPSKTTCKSFHRPLLPKAAMLVFDHSCIAAALLLSLWQHAPAETNISIKVQAEAERLSEQKKEKKLRAAEL